MVQCKAVKFFEDYEIAWSIWSLTFYLGSLNRYYILSSTSPYRRLPNGSCMIIIGLFYLFIYFFFYEHEHTFALLLLQALDRIRRGLNVDPNAIFPLISFFSIN